MKIFDFKKQTYDLGKKHFKQTVSSESVSFFEKAGHLFRVTQSIILLFAIGIAVGSVLLVRWLVETALK